MKTTKIFALVFVLALMASSCAKSKVKPRCSHEKEQETETTNTASSRISSASAENDQLDTGEDNFTIFDIVGSGDDDRDGGDKKAKAGGR